MFVVKGSLAVHEKIHLAGRGNSIGFDSTSRTYEFKIDNRPPVFLIANNGVTMAVDLNVDNVLFVDTVNDRIGINTLTPTVALDVVGDGEFSGDLVVQGDLNVNGTLTSFSTDILVIEDPMIKLAKNNPADLLDTGYYALFNDGTTRFAGIFRDATDGVFKLFTGTTAEPGNTVDLTNGDFVFGDLEIRALTGATATLSGDVTIDTDTFFVDATTGQVGIRTISPGAPYALDVSGNVQVRQTLDVDGNLIVNVNTLFVNSTTSKVGVGITNPVETFEVIGSIGVSGKILPLLDDTFDIGSGVSQFRDIWFSGDIFQNGVALAHPWVGTTDIFYNDGNVGIGTTTPERKLDIVSSDTRPLRIETTSTTQNGILLINNTGTTGDQWQLRFDKDSDLGITGSFVINHLQSGGPFWDALTLNRTGITQGTLVLGDFVDDECDLHVNGKLGVGTVSPVNELEVIGSIGVSGDVLPLLTNVFNLGSTTARFNDLFLNGASLHLADSIISAPNVTDIQISTSGTVKFALASTGEALFFTDSSVGDTSSMMILRKDVITGVTDNRYINFEDGTSDIFTPGTPLGGIRVDGGGTLAIDTVSSIILKENVRDNADECYDIVKALRGVKFDWRSGRAKDCNGFIAEEVREHYPIASGCINGIKTVSMASFIPILWSALRKSMEKMDELETKHMKKIKELETKYGCITFVDDKNYSYTSPQQIEDSKKLLEQTENTSNNEYQVFIGDKVYTMGKDGTKQIQ